jgi:cell division protein ZapA
MNDKLTINLSIGGYSFPVNIDRKDEELVRAAAKQVETRYNNFRAHFEVTPFQAMTMAAYQSAVNEFEGKTMNDTEPYSTRIKDLSELLEEYIQKTEQ